MVISQPPGNNWHYYRVSPTLFNCLNAPRDTLCSIHAIKHCGNFIEMEVLSIFYTNQIHGGIITSFFIHFVAHALAFI